LPVGGAIAVTEYSYVDVFRPWLLSNAWSLGQMGHWLFEEQII